MLPIAHRLRTAARPCADPGRRPTGTDELPHRYLIHRRAAVRAGQVPPPDSAAAACQPPHPPPGATLSASRNPGYVSYEEKFYPPRPCGSTRATTRCTRRRSRGGDGAGPRSPPPGAALPLVRTRAPDRSRRGAGRRLQQRRGPADPDRLRTRRRAMLVPPAARAPAALTGTARRCCVPRRPPGRAILPFPRRLRP